MILTNCVYVHWPLNNVGVWHFKSYNLIAKHATNTKSNQ